MDNQQLNSSGLRNPLTPRLSSIVYDTKKISSQYDCILRGRSRSDTRRTKPHERTRRSVYTAPLHRRRSRGNTYQVSTLTLGKKVSALQPYSILRGGIQTRTRAHSPGSRSTTGPPRVCIRFSCSRGPRRARRGSPSSFARVSPWNPSLLKETRGDASLGPVVFDATGGRFKALDLRSTSPLPSPSPLV